MTLKRVSLKIARILAIVVTSLLLLVFLIIIFINIPAGKKVVRNKIQSFLVAKLKTKVQIGKINYSLPEWIELKNVYIEDQNSDTLFVGEEMRVDINMFKLLKGNTDIQKVYFKNMFINIQKKDKDTAYNFEFVMKAFTGNQQNVNPDTAALKISLDRLVFDNVALRFNDEVAGSNFNSKITFLDGTLTRFQPDRLQFFIDDFTARGVEFVMNTTKATPPTVPVDTDTTITPYQLHITANKFNLQQVFVSVKDHTDNFLYENNVSDLRLVNAEFDMNRLVAGGDSILLSDSRVELNLPPPIVRDTDSVLKVMEPWRYHAGHIALSNNKIRFDNHAFSKAGGLDFNHLNTENLQVIANDFQYTPDTTKATVTNLAFEDAGGFVMDTTHAVLLLTDKIFSATELFVKTKSSLIRDFVEITYDSIGGIAKYPENSSVKAVLNNTTIAFNDLYMVLPALDKAFPKKDFAGNSVNINTELRGSLERVYIPALYLNGFSGSSISARGTLYNLTDAERFSYDLHIINSRILKNDLLKFIPDESRAAFREYPPVINFSGHLKGNTNSLTADVNTNASGLALQGKITLTNISDPLKLKYDFNMRQAVLSKNFIEGFLPETLPPGFSLPQTINAKGSLKGSQNDFYSDLVLSTSYGNAKVKGSLKNIKDPSRLSYDMIVSPQDFNLGKLLGQDSIMGIVSGTVIAKGSGTDIKTMISDINFDIQKLSYNNYTYNNITGNASFNRGSIESKASVNDDHLKLKYDLTADVRNEYPVLKALVDVDTAQLAILNLYPDTMNVSFQAAIDAKNLRPRQLDATVYIDSSRIQTAKGTYLLDTIALTASSVNGTDDINFRSPFADINAEGAFDYDRIVPAIVQYIDGYYDIGATEAKPITGQQVEIKGEVRKHPIVTEFVPGLNDYQPITFSGNYSSAIADSALNFSANIPYLNYETNYVRNGNITINSRNERLNYAADFDTLQSGTQKFYGTRLNGSAAQDSLSIAFITQDQNRRDWFGLNASMHVNGPVYTFRLNDNMLLNYENWSVAPGNFIEYGPGHVLVNNFNITSDTASIRINSNPLVVNSPVQLVIDNFNLSTLSSFISNDTLFASGILDADITLSEFTSNIPAFTGNASITGVNIMQQPVGDITLNAQRRSASEVYADINLTGNNNDVKLAGSYLLNNPTNDFIMRADVNKLNLATLQGFSAGSITNASGNVHGTIDVTGKFSNPNLNGELIFDTTQFTIAQFGTPYRINNEKIIFQHPVIRMDDFTIRDSLDNQMTVNGTVTAKTLTNYDLNLRIRAEDFLLINARKAVNNQLYGVASVDANVSVKGNSVSPDIEGNVFLNDNSDVTIVLPERSFNKNESKRIVRFVDTDTFNIYKPPLFSPEKESSGAFGQFLNYNINIEVTREAKMNIIVDPVTGDQLTVQGDARLNAGVDPGGNIILAGHYELEQGSYELNYQFLQKNFNLIKGSTIDFAGDPMDARVNITAEYIANTSAKDLLQNEVTATGTQLSNAFNQKIPFRVVLKLTGALRQPEINFDIQMPDENSPISSELRTTIENKLVQLRGDQSATNKQVFSLLLFNRFVGEESSDFFKGSEGGGGFNDLARQSVSQFLSSAMNEIAANLFKGIDVDLNMNTYRDYTATGSQQRTDLNVAVSKTLMNERLVISVGTNVGIEGEDPVAKTGTRNGFSPDIQFAYKLTPDGKYMLRAYRKNQFEVVLDGYVTETGLAFVVTMDYDVFKELFHRKKK